MLGQFLKLPASGLNVCLSNGFVCLFIFGRKLVLTEPFFWKIHEYSSLGFFWHLHRCYLSVDRCRSTEHTVCVPPLTSSRSGDATWELSHLLPAGLMESEALKVLFCNMGSLLNDMNKAALFISFIVRAANWKNSAFHMHWAIQLAFMRIEQGAYLRILHLA